MLVSQAQLQELLLTKIVIEDVTLYVRKVKVASSVITCHEIGLTKHNATYPLQRCEIISYAIPQGSLLYDKDNLFRSQMPKMLVFGLVSNTAFGGAYDKSPFNFQHFDTNVVALS